MHVRKRGAVAGGPCAAAMVGLGYGNLAKADTVALTPNVSQGYQYFDYLVGMDFDTNVPITITQLGVFDNSNSGVLALDNPIHPITVQIYDRVTGVAIATSYFGDGYSTGTDTPEGSGNVFFQPLATPL
jgi:hypothetical protein